MTYIEKVQNELKINSKVSLSEIKKRCPGIADKTFYNIRTKWRKSQKTKKKGKGKKKGKVSSSSNDTTKGRVTTASPQIKIIDDPDELLYSVAIRELNKIQPDPRWASILIQCRKEIGKRKTEMIDTLQNLPTKQLIEILEKQSGKSLPPESTN